MDKFRHSRFYRSFAKFSHQTAVKPLSFIQNSEFTAEAILWTIVIAVFTSLTVWNVYDTVERFRRHETLTNVKVKGLRQVDFADTALCVKFETQFKHISSNSVNMQIPSVPNYLSLLESLSRQLQTNADDISTQVQQGSSLDISDFQQHCGNLKNDKPNRTLNVACLNAINYRLRESFDRIMQNATLMLQTVSGILWYVTQAENSLDDYNWQHPIVAQTDIPCCTTSNCTVGQLLMREMSNSLHFFIRVIGSIVCHNLGVVVGFGSRQPYRLINPCAIENVIRFGSHSFNGTSAPEYVCLNLSLTNLFKFDSDGSNEAVFVYVRPSDRSFDPEFFLDFNGNVGKNDANLNRIYFESRSITETKMEIVGDYRRYRNENPSTKNDGECTMQCIAMDSVRQCNCWPSRFDSFMLKATKERYPVCTLFLNCSQTSEDRVSRISICYRTMCEQNAYDVRLLRFDSTTTDITELHLFDLDTQNSHFTDIAPSEPEPLTTYIPDTIPPNLVPQGPPGSNLFKRDSDSLIPQGPPGLNPLPPDSETPDSPVFAVFTLKNFIYPEFDEVLAMDVRSFLSALGGSLSIYIGASFIAIIHVVVYILRSAYEYMAVTPTAEKSVQSEAAKAGTHAAQQTDFSKNRIPGHCETIAVVDW